MRRLLTEAEWSGAQLAREVVALGGEEGMSLHYDRTAVAHWLAGSQPRPPVPALVAEALSRRLGRTVLIQDTGLADGASWAYEALRCLSAEGGGVEHLKHALMAVDRREAGLLGTYSIGALAIPAWGRFAKEPPLPQRDTGRSVDMADVASAQELLAVFSRFDAAFGAGQVREPLRRYLTTTMLDRLKTEAKPGVRRELFTVAAQLAYLCGFMFFDSGRQAEAQHFYLASVKLAREAGDRLGYALALRGLSVQAHSIRHFGNAHELAERAVQIGARHAPPHQRAFLLGQLAVTQASFGELEFARHLVAAERFLEQSSSSGPGIGVFHAGSLALQRAAVARSQGNLPEAVRELDLSLRYRPAEEQRSRAICLAELAETRLEMGHLEHACQVWNTFLDLLPSLKSERIDNRLRVLIERIRPHAANQTAATLLRRALEVRRETS
ncbi:hypothetical protein GCM10028832_01800 [Streptomyces sparsus]